MTTYFGYPVWVFKELMIFFFFQVMSEDDAFSCDDPLNLSGNSLWGESDFSVDDHDSSFASLVSTPPSSAPTTPNKTPKEAKDRIFKKPAPPSFGTCPKCRKSLKTAKGFNNHMLNHRVKGW